MGLRQGPLAVNVDPQGAGICATWGGIPAISRCFPMVPLGNRVQGNAFTHDGQTHRFTPNTDEPLYLHGDGWLGLWQASATETTARLTFDHPAPAASPHRYRAAMDVALGPARLTVTLSVTNTGPALPFGLGLHPFFPRHPMTRVTAQAGAFWTEGPGHLPASPGPIPGTMTLNGPLPGRRLNNAYQDWCGRARIDQPDLRIDLSAEPIFAHLMVYAPKGGDQFCLEPMTHLPNALARGLPMAVLAPGESLSGKVVFDFSQPE